MASSREAGHSRFDTTSNLEPAIQIKIEVESDEEIKALPRRANKGTETTYAVTLQIKPGDYIKKDIPTHYNLYPDNFEGIETLKNLRSGLIYTILRNNETYRLSEEVDAEKHKLNYKRMFRFIAKFLSCDLCNEFLYNKGSSHKTDYSKLNVCRNCAETDDPKKYDINLHTRQLYNVLMKHIYCFRAIKCIYKRNGCKEKYPPNNTWAEHELTCGYQKVRCFFNNCDCTMQYCEVQKHIETYHKESIIDQLQLTEAFDISPKIFFENSSTYILMEDFLSETANSVGVAIFKAEPPIFEGNLDGSFVIKVYPNTETMKAIKDERMHVVHGSCLRSPLYMLRYKEFVLQHCTKYSMQYIRGLSNRYLLVGFGRLNENKQNVSSFF